MSWRLAFHSAKVLFSYLIPYKIRIFRDAIFDKNFDLIRKLAAERPKMLQQAVDADGNTAIGLAILLGEPETLKLLLELGSDPNVANAFDGNHALFILAKLRLEENSKTIEMAKILLDAGSDPLYPVQHQADNANRIDATQTPACHENPLFCCIRFQNEELLKTYLEHRINLNDASPETGMTALMLATELGYHRICQMLIEAGADVNVSDFIGNTALHMAAQGYGEQTAIIKTLLQNGADPQATNDDGLTPAIVAKRLGKDEHFKLLDVKIDEVQTKQSEDQLENIKVDQLLSFV